MLAFILSGLAIVITVLMLLFRTNMRRWLGYVNLVDVLFTFALFAMFHGTFSGIVSAAFAGIFMSVSLQLIRQIMGCEKLRFVRTPWYKGFTKLNWVYYPPSEMSFYGFKRKVAT